MTSADDSIKPKRTHARRPHHRNRDYTVTSITENPAKEINRPALRLVLERIDRLYRQAHGIPLEEPEEGVTP
jgi:hypothetical protein